MEQIKGAKYDDEFLLTPLREGRPDMPQMEIEKPISTHAPAGGATIAAPLTQRHIPLFLLTPLREGRQPSRPIRPPAFYFYSRPCGRGDSICNSSCTRRGHFYSRPCGRGDPHRMSLTQQSSDFYSRPCGRGDAARLAAIGQRPLFLLTPLREGRHDARSMRNHLILFLLTPLREGRQQFSTSPS